MPLTRIQGYGHVAARYGLGEAIFLDTIVHWYRVNRADGRNYHDGRWWTYNSIAAYTDQFPWWSAKQIRRIAASLREQGALLTGNYNSNGRDRTIWYSPSDEALALYGIPAEDAQTGNCICPNGQMQMPEQANADAQTGQPLPCSYHVNTNIPPYSPPTGDPQAETPKPRPKGKPKPKKTEPYRLDWFEAFWNIYPRKDNKQAALRAWCKLKPDRALCGVMAAALERDKHSKQWCKDGGEFIPMASTWINQRRWNDQGVDQSQLPDPPDPPDDGGWAPDPEVIE